MAEPVKQTWTVDDYRQAAKRAMDAGDVQSAQELIDAGMALEASRPRGFGEMVYENVVGRGAVDTPGERLGELIRGGAAAAVRGIADVPAIPANLVQLGVAGYEKLTGADTKVGNMLEALPDTRDMMSAATGGASDYVAPGTAGDYVSTIGEFAGGGCSDFVIDSEHVVLNITGNLFFIVIV